MNKAYYAYLRSPEWAEIKVDLIQQRGNKCEGCGKKNKLQVHHLTYDRIFKEEPGYLQLLCATCHRKTHGLNKNGKKIKPRKPKKKKGKRQLTKFELLLKKQRTRMKKKWMH